MKTLSLLLAPTLVLTLIPAASFADGTFVEPKFVWDKHKDINEPTQKAIIVYDAGEEDLILQVKYEGPLDQFGWLIPVPNLPTVTKGSMKCFYELSKFTQQRYLDYQWQTRRGTYGADSAAEAEPEVKVVETKTVGAYETAVLSAKDSGTLKRWLGDNQFYIPPDKSSVLDSYIQQHWYFIVVKINLDKSAAASTSTKLASGELNPLQISFASDRCIFPLKISSINGKPSEVQVYVLASEPLLEQRLFEKELAVTYSNDMATVERANQYTKQMQERLERLGGTPPIAMDDGFPDHIRSPQATPDELLQFAGATIADLPDCKDMIPRLIGKPLWIAKKTWTFNPQDMHDLDFGPAMPVLAETLGSKYGYVAAADLRAIGPEAVPILMTALNGTSHAARANAADALEGESSDPRLKPAAPAWLKNSEPKVRLLAIDVLGGPVGSDPGPNFITQLIPLLNDEDAWVREVAGYSIAHCPNLQQHASLFHKMLTDTNPPVRISALHVFVQSGLPIDRNELIPFFKIPSAQAIGMATGYFRDARGFYDISNEQAKLLLQNSEPIARIIGLRVLGQHGDTESLALAEPFLNDPDPIVQRLAARTLGVPDN